MSSMLTFEELKRTLAQHQITFGIMDGAGIALLEAYLRSSDRDASLGPTKLKIPASRRRQPTSQPFFLTVDLCR